MSGNVKADALEDILPLDAAAFKTKRTGAGRAAIALDAVLLERIKAIVVANGGMMGGKFFTSDLNATTAYNDQRATAAKTAGKEAPAPISIEGHATILARKDAARFTPYVESVADNLTDDKGEPASKAVSLRVRNEGTGDHPQCRWAFVLVNHRERKADATATPSA
jgi:hypothetical protein